MSTRREFDGSNLHIYRKAANRKLITIEEAERLEKKKKLKEELGLSSDSSEAFYFIAYYYVFREEGKKERVSIVTFKDNLPIQEIRNQIILCLMSSSLRIKNDGVIAWLIDNCGFSFQHENFDTNHVIYIPGLKKGNLVFHDEDNSIDFHTTCSGSDISTTIYFKLYGSLGLKVYDSIKALQSNPESYENYFLQVIIPDLDNAIWTKEFRRQRCSEVMEFLLHREHPEFDFSKREDLLEFFFSCLQMLYQFGTSYTNTLDLNWEAFKHSIEVQMANRILQVKKSYVRYLYHKKQYLLAKKNKPVALCQSRDIDKQTVDLFDENQLYLSSKYNIKEMKLMYKIAKQNYLAEKRNQKDKNVFCLGQLLEIPIIRKLIYWIRSKVIRDWFKENHWDVDFLFTGL